MMNSVLYTDLINYLERVHSTVDGNSYFSHFESPVCVTTALRKDLRATKSIRILSVFK
jgi:hypothetical protein